MNRCLLECVKFTPELQTNGALERFKCQGKVDSFEVA